ncbi:HlyD family secretion protein [Motilimonas sp. KMU-193]|uniref:HlyD family secretion protein n=1 Tax=Motilimonas sp. KMU-193 TaxID=3388668 RepID=UPI00396B0104
MKLLALCCFTLCLFGCQQGEPRVFGQVERDRLTLTAPVSEQVAEIWVSEGQQVTAGMPLLRLNDSIAQARVQQKQAELAQAQAKLAELLAGARSEEIERAEAVIAEAKANVIQAQQDFSRIQRLYKTRVLTKSDLDQAQAALTTAQAKQEQAQQSWQQLHNGTRSEQVAQGRALVAAAQASLAIEQQHLADLTLVAQQAAIVDVLPWQVGDRVMAGTQLVGLLATQRPYVRAYVPATWLDRVSVGSSVRILVDGRAEALSGTVRKVRSEPAYTPFYALNERDRARLMYLTDIDLDLAGQTLPTGLNLEVELLP